MGGRAADFIPVVGNLPASAMQATGTLMQTGSVARAAEQAAYAAMPGGEYVQAYQSVNDTWKNMHGELSKSDRRNIADTASEMIENRDNVPLEVAMQKEFQSLAEKYSDPKMYHEAVEQFHDTMVKDLLEKQKEIHKSYGALGRFMNGDKYHEEMGELQMQLDNLGPRPGEEPTAGQLEAHAMSVNSGAVMSPGQMQQQGQAPGLADKARGMASNLEGLMQEANIDPTQLNTDNLGAAAQNLIPALAKRFIG